MYVFYRPDLRHEAELLAEASHGRYDAVIAAATIIPAGCRFACGGRARRPRHLRVPSLESGIIGKMLDAGAFGIICPMVSTREQCEHFVRSCRYAPLGHRSMGPVRATMYAGADYAAHANDSVIAMAMIETQEAIDNLDEILSTPGLDAIFVGPSDLSVSMGHSPGFDPRFPNVYEAIERIAEACKRHGVVAGIHTGSIEYTREMEALGYRFFAFLSEFRFMALNGAKYLSELKATKTAPSTTATESKGNAYRIWTKSSKIWSRSDRHYLKKFAATLKAHLVHLSKRKALEL